MFLTFEKMMKIFYTLIFIVTLAQTSYSQKNIDTVGVIGGVLLNKRNVEISKKTFLNEGKITTNIKGVHVKKFNYSLFTLGRSATGVVYGSVFTNELIKYVSNKQLNYRYVNFEDITFVDSIGNIFYPKIITVKIKFKY